MDTFRSAEARAERKRVKRAFLSGLKEEPCLDCGSSFVKEAMTFDHRPGEVKKGDIWKMVDHPTSTLKALRLELSKCDLVCVGCHRDRTQSRLVPGKRHSRSSVLERRKDAISLIKSVPCVDCGNSYSSWKMDFDHTGSKVDNISDMVGRFVAWNKVLEEIAKCEIVCCWCHVNRTVARIREAA